jgi:hypothetical protein
MIQIDFLWVNFNLIFIQMVRFFYYLENENEENEKKIIMFFESIQVLIDD